ncbi:DUF2293 domain-containing protein, partial [Streptomyces sp. SID14478]|uniref:DUF2293 domain-containing protein n=1 Tax=Streptomyces sp. SID14478 TaxID=2706073 RepID=UPI0013DFF81B
SAAGRALSEGAVTAAVRAAVRHVDTPYDRLLMEGAGWKAARAEVAGTVAAVLDAWRAGAGPERGEIAAPGPASGA